MTDLPARRATILADIENMERQAGATLLDTGLVDAAAILQAKGELAVIDAAESEADRRHREASATARAEARREAAGKARAELEGLRAAAKAAQDHAANLAASLAVITGHGKRLAGLSRT